MSKELENVVCEVCGNEVCTCNEVSAPIRRRINIDFDNCTEDSCECECDCDCEDICDCEGECICEKKKALAFLGASIATVAVAGGILYLVKRKK